MGKVQRKEKRLRKKQNKKDKAIWIAEKHPEKPRSELWFDKQLKLNDIRFPFEENCVFAGFIPDYINKHYKVIVEVDGSIHELDHVKIKDKRKTKKFESLGFTVIRVKAYDINSLENCLVALRKIRLSKPL